MEIIKKIKINYAYFIFSLVYKSQLLLYLIKKAKNAKTNNIIKLKQFIIN